MFRNLVVFFLTVSILAGPMSVSVPAQTLSPTAQKVKTKAEKRAKDQSRTKVKLLSDATYVGIVGDIGDTAFTVTDKSGSKHTVQYSEVRSIGGTGWSTGAKLGLGIAIGAGAVLGVLAAIVASND